MDEENNLIPDRPWHRLVRVLVITTTLSVVSWSILVGIRHPKGWTDVVYSFENRYSTRKDKIKRGGTIECFADAYTQPDRRFWCGRFESEGELLEQLRAHELSRDKLAAIVTKRKMALTSGAFLDDKFEEFDAFLASKGYEPRTRDYNLMVRMLANDDEVEAGSRIDYNHLARMLALSDEVEAGSRIDYNLLAGMLALSDEVEAGSRIDYNLLARMLANDDEVEAGSRTDYNLLARMLALTDEVEAGSRIDDSLLVQMLALTDDNLLVRVMDSSQRNWAEFVEVQLVGLYLAEEGIQYYYKTRRGLNGVLLVAGRVVMIGLGCALLGLLLYRILFFIAYGQPIWRNPTLPK